MDAAYSTAGGQFNARAEVSVSLPSGVGLLAESGPLSRRQRASVGPSRRRSQGAVLSLACFMLACGETFDGPPELVPAQLSRSLDSLVPVADGDSLDLLPPIQGGYVLFVGAALHNFSRQGGGSLLGELRRARAADGTPLNQPGAVLYSDERTVGVIPLPGSFPVPNLTTGWQLSAPNPNDTANISTCPNPLDLSIVDSELFLQITFRDRVGRSATSYRKVVPRCAQADAMTAKDCRCQCGASYQPQKCTI